MRVRCGSASSGLAASLGLALVPLAAGKFAISSVADALDGGLSVTTLDNDPGNGHLAVLVASVSDNTLTLFQHDGSGFAASVVTSASVDAQAAAAADLNGDAVVDYLVAGSADNTVRWYEDTGTPTHHRHVLTDSADGAAALAAADLNGDKRMDVVVASSLDNTISVFFNEGDGNFAQRAVTRSLLLVSAIVVADVDSDAHLDLISGSGEGGRVVWWQNDGKGGFTEHLINDDRRIDGVAAIAAADMDNDGDTDVVVASANTNSVVWFENAGDSSFDRQPHTITRDSAVPHSLGVADFNGDGFVDVAVASAGPGEVAWHENDGAGSRFVQRTLLSTVAAGDGGLVPYSIAVADMDRDGDSDVVVGTVGGKVAWLENRDGGAFATEHVISAGAGDPAAPIKTEL